MYFVFQSTFNIDNDKWKQQKLKAGLTATVRK